MSEGFSTYGVEVGGVYNSVETKEDEGQTAPPPKKRRQTVDTRMVYSRKRAVAACQLCRSRKSKCDNQRPTCGTCLAFGAECVFKDRESDHSTFDSASLAILDRLNYAIRLLETSPSNASHELQLPSLASLAAGSNGLAESGVGSCLPVHQEPGFFYSASPGNMESSGDFLNDANVALTDALNINSRCSGTDVLGWPVFQGHVKDDSTVEALFETSSNEDSALSPRGSFAAAGSSTHRPSPSFVRSSAGGIREENTLALIEDFLRNVHTKNPILDPTELLEMGRTVAEEGFGWDDRSCLVLITCALGSLSTPWNMAVPMESEASRTDAENYPQAEAYYTAARKRVGLLGNSVLATQCVFLTAVYEMYSLRPISAWLSFSRACTLFQLHLHSRPPGHGQAYRRLEQRLYWSCLKSECEMREELDLPPSGLAKAEYPDVFPSPPGSTPDPESGETAGRGPWELVVQRSWYYYLSEIASRRIANRTITALYGMPDQAWLSIPVRRLHRIALELDTQLVQWWEHIPGSPSPGVQSDMDELTFQLHARYLDFRERVWRPFLYIAVHTEPAPADRDLVLTNATRCLDLVFELLRAINIKHRHHGCWYSARSMFTRALLILAAVQSRRLDIGPDWEKYIHLARTFLQYWEEEAPDLRIARLRLLDLLASVKQGVETPAMG